MISFDEAVERVRSIAKPLGTEMVRLEDGAGRVLCEAVVALIDSPRSDVSAMDGYALKDNALGVLPASLRIIGESFAGAGSTVELSADACIRIFTGAPVPQGADRVVIQEKVRRDRDRAIIDEVPGSSRNIRTRGSDFKAGDQLLSAGRLLDPRAIVTAAAADVAELAVYRQPRVHILATGDELAEPGAARSNPYSIPESVSYGVAALAQKWGAFWTGSNRLPDELPAMQAAAAQALQSADIVVVTGGASVGEKDFARTMFAPLGLELVFSKVSIKPGKPVWLGRVGEKLILGLPGNPTSALVTARLILAPLLAGVTGRPIEHGLSWYAMPLASPLAGANMRETFHRARALDRAAEVLTFQDSSAQKVLADATLLVRQRAESADLAVGALVEVLDF